VPSRAGMERSDDTFVALANVQAAPATREVDEAVAVKILNYRPTALLDDEWGIGSNWSSGHR